MNIADPSFAIFIRIETLDKCFGHDTVEEIIDALVSKKLFYILFLSYWKSCVPLICLVDDILNR